MASNKFGGTCEACGGYAKPGTGSISKIFGKWRVTHFKCPESGTKVVTTRFSSGAVVTMNARGRCIDAPCCGCCD